MVFILFYDMEVVCPYSSNFRRNIIILPLCFAGLLCLWFYAAGLPDSHHCNHLCNNCGDIFLAKCRELSLAVDVVLLCCLNSSICVFVLCILLLCENQDVRLLPDQLLLRIHFDVLSWFGNPLR